MGVKNLWLILAPVCERKSLSELRGKSVAIDLSCWVCDSQNVENTNQPRMYLRNLFFRTSCLLLLGVRPVFVLEGIAPMLKHAVISQRVEKRARCKKKSSSSEDENIKNSRPCKEKNVGTRSRLNSILKQCAELLRLMGVACVQSLGEAEALCAQLNNAGLVDGCITQDGDCFLYGAQTVFRNFTISHHGSTGYSVEEYKMAVIEEKLSLSRQKLIALSLLCGCDYNDKGVLGVGKESALKFLAGLQDKEVIDRLKKWRTDELYEHLEAEYAVLGNTCTKCSHVGKLQKHKKSGCSECGSPVGCNEPTDSSHLSLKDPEERKIIIAELLMRRKALKDENFPCMDTVNEFLHTQPLPKFDLTWKQPDIISFIKYSSKLLGWAETYAIEKFVPLVTRWQLYYIQNDTRKDSKSQTWFMPITVIKKRVLRGIPSFEVKWKDNRDCLQNFDQIEDLLITVEPQELFETAYPDLVEDYIKAKEEKSKKGKKNKKLKPKKALKCSHLCHNDENEGPKNSSKEGHLCEFFKSSHKSEDVSENRNILGNLDINSESTKGNMKQLKPSRNIGVQRKIPKSAKKQTKLTFNGLYRMVAQNAEIRQLSQKNTAETNVDSEIQELTRDMGILNLKCGDNVRNCKPIIEVDIQGSGSFGSCSPMPLENLENLSPNKSETKGILEEYDCLDVDDSIMDMSSIIEGIVGENYCATHGN